MLVLFLITILDATHTKKNPAHSETKGYIDEADWFFLDPSAFISAHYRDCTDPAREAPACDRAHGFSLQGVCEEEPDSWCWPSHIVMYDVLWPKVEPQLAGKGYAQVCAVGVIACACAYSLAYAVHAVVLLFRPSHVFGVHAPTRAWIQCTTSHFPSHS